MTRREVIRGVLEGQEPPYVPWHLSFTPEAAEKLAPHRTAEIDDVLRGHLLGFAGAGEQFTHLGNDQYADAFGVIWDRSRDKEIGNVANRLLPEPKLDGLTLPDPADPAILEPMREAIASGADGLRVYSIGFSLYERAWTLRGMEALMMDFLEHPRFVHDLLGTIADWNIAQAQAAMACDIDAVYFGDDWGMQHGLQMGYPLWKEFIYPQLERMYGAVRAAGKYVFIHSCGDVDELFDDLVGIGVNCFNPFQPEVMDVPSLLVEYRGRLTFHGGLSTQKTLPYGTPQDVRDETRRLIELGRPGSYVLAPAHSVPRDVPVENILAVVEEIRETSGAYEE